MKASVFLAWLAAALVLASAAVLAQEPEGQLAREVGRAVSGMTQLTIFDDISTQVQDGYVLLAGSVTLPQKRGEAEKRAAAVPGVRGVRNDIGVLPASPADDALRYKLARAIYGNPAFWTYAAMAQPPIRIIVAHGRVTLRGYVHSNTDRMLAQSLATGVGEVSVSNELRTESEASARKRP